MTQTQKVLIGDDSLELGIAWATAFKDAGLYAITRPKRGKAIIDYALTEKPVAVIIDAKTPEIDVCDIIRMIRDSIEYDPVIIVTANYDSAAVESEVMECGADYYMVRPFLPVTLVSRTLAMIDERISENSKVPTEDLELTVTDIIHQIGIPAHVKGYHYLRAAIILATENPDVINCVTKVLYPTVAQKYDTTPSRVERAIRHAIEIAWDRGDVDVLDSYFGYTINTGRGKPTNSEFIALIADKLRLRYKTESTSITEQILKNIKKKKSLIKA